MKLYYEYSSGYAFSPFILLDMYNSSSFICIYEIPLYVYQHISIHYIVDRHSDCSQFLTITKKKVLHGFKHEYKYKQININMFIYTTYESPCFICSTHLRIKSFCHKRLLSKLYKYFL